LRAHVDPRRRRRLLTAALLALVGALFLGGLPGAADAKKKKKRDTVKVMSRNVYLGADLGPALRANTTGAFAKRVGDIYNDVQFNDFPSRAEALAAEIKNNKVDLVGLQEVSKWRVQFPPDGPPFPFGSGQSAQTNLFDYLDLLMAELNRGAVKPATCKKQRRKAKRSGSKQRKRKARNCYSGYRFVTGQEEFDFEAPANTFREESNDPTPPPAGNFFNIDLDLRLTMRDVILARKGAGIKTTNLAASQFNSRLVLTAGLGFTVPVQRGWNALDANVRGKRFHFVNTHLEAFDSPSFGFPDRGRIRQAQAQELVAPGGPATSPNLPVVLVGDLNSNSPLGPTQQPGDDLAFQVMLGAGFSTRSPIPPQTCCFESSRLNNPASIVNINHTVDHNLANSPAVRRVDSFVTGDRMFRGLWPSDHLGVFSELAIPGKAKKK
jgi:endonuclease/exonuclease/phosphatase family metal-dependent hydrolase